MAAGEQLCEVLFNILGFKVPRLVNIKIDWETKRLNRAEMFSTKAAWCSKTMEHLRFIKVKKNIIFNSFKLGSLARNGFYNWNLSYFIP